MLEIKVVTDTNDADYVTRISHISEADLERIKPLIAKIKAFKPYTVKAEQTSYISDWTHSHNYPFGERQREDLGEKSPREIYSDIPEEVFDLFEEFVDGDSETGSFHTVESIEVYPIPVKTKLL